MTTITSAETMQLSLATASGYTTRTILRTPVRDALASEIPFIDISPIFSDSLADRQAVARKIHDAASNEGFFYIKNHGIPLEVVDKAHAACLDFFRQDIDIKKKTNANAEESMSNGYRAPETQRINLKEGIDLRENYCITYDPRIDPTIADLANIPKEAGQYHLPGGHPWEHTSNLPHFKTDIMRYFQECLVLARALTHSFALSLNLPEEFFDGKVKYPEATFEPSFYPPIATSTNSEAPKQAELDLPVSIGSHTDWQLFTILWQDDVGGLQVLNREGQWISAPPVQNSLVVNVADYMQRMTNDKYVSAVHRVRNVSGRERLSIPFFWGFGMQESCGVLETCLEEGEKKKYDEVKCIDWISLRTASYMLASGNVQ